MTQAERDIKRKKKVLEQAALWGNVSKTCRYFGISRQTFYEWKRAYEAKGDEGLVNRKPGCAPGTSKNRTPPEIEEKILYIRKRYHFGPQRISWYLERYHGIRITAGGVYYVLRRNGNAPAATIEAQARYPELQEIREAGPRPSRPGRREVPLVHRR